MNASTASEFQVGKTYTARSICDNDCRWAFKVLKRTAKRITVECDGTTQTIGTSFYNGEETAFPLGRYSMAPIIRASASN